MAPTDLTLALFTIFNALRLASYIPQLIVLARDATGARSISAVSWGIWIGANATTAAHLHMIGAGATVVAITALNTLSCMSVMGLIVWKRLQFRRATQPTPRWRDAAPEALDPALGGRGLPGRLPDTGRRA